MTGTILWINEEARYVGGCETYMANTVAELNKRGWSNKLLYNFLSPPDKQFAGLFDEAYPLVTGEKQIEGMEPHIIFVNRWKDERLYSLIPKLDVPTLIKFHDSTPFCLRNHGMNYFTGKACDHCLGFRCILDGGFIGKGSGVTGLSYHSLYAKKRILEKARACTRYLVSSEYMVNVLEKHKFVKSRICKIPLFVKEPEAVTSEKQEIPVILYVGQLIRGKGVDILLDAMAKVHGQVLCRIVGSGNYEKVLRNNAHDLGISHMVEFIPHVPQKELARHYKNALAVVVPSRAPETFCLVGPEAMSYGTPVIGVDNGGIREWLKDGKNGTVVAPYDADEMAGAIDRLIDAPDVREKMSQQAFQDYARKYTVTEYCNRFVFLIESLIQERKGLAA